ncbi:MAG: hypothetical protein IPK82_18935 [Polyangiaceae bacterium]|nr:hypothetical protein [Polyangiaceae bacterium]
MQQGPIQIADLERLAAADAPDLADAVKAFVDQEDPELETPARDGAITMDTFVTQIAQAAAQRTSRARSEKAQQAWQRFLGQTDPAPPPRFALADLLVKLYERGSEPARAALLKLVDDAPIAFGLLGGFKRIYKLAEKSHDFGLYSALSMRFDVEATRRHSRWDKHNISRGTLVYLRKRSARYLRSLGFSVPRLYALLGAQMLARVPANAPFEALHVVGAIVGRTKPEKRSRRGRRKPAKTAPTDPLSKRAFEAAWKISPEPLLYLLEACVHPSAAAFAAAALRKDFPEVLRNPNVPWIARLCHRPVESVHDLVVELLTSTPELHQAKLRERGLHEAALLLLTSPSDKARKYAIAYARAHAPDLSVDRLLVLADEEKMDDRFGGTYEETAKFAAELLMTKAPRDLGLDVLGKMLGIGGTSKFAAQAITKSFGREELPEKWLIDQIYGEDAQHEFVLDLIEKKFPKGSIGSGFWIRVLDDPRREDHYQATGAALTELGKLPLASIDSAWLSTALTRDGLSDGIGEMLQKADKLPPGMDVEKLKGLVFHPAHRSVALAVLGSPKLVKPRDLGLSWLLALARRADATLHDFAHRILLEHMKPADFDDGGKYEAGVARLFALAAGEKEPEPVRQFAQTYLRCHHPVVGPNQSETKELMLTPALDRSVYTSARIWPLFTDERADVRKFALVIAKAELRTWGDHTRVYELSDLPAKEVRLFAYEALLNAGEKSADAACTLAPEELSAAGVLGMAESREQKTREVAMELFRRHYARLGGAERLGWLMQSADREVQKFAVRLLWEKHRPRAIPDDYKPKKSAGPVIERAGDFKDNDALRTLLRRTLFALPPGRAKEAADAGAPKRRLPASEVKRNVVEIVRDLAIEDAEFAEVVAPILREMIGSAAKGETHVCLSALAHVHKAHPGLVRFAEGGA